MSPYCQHCGHELTSDVNFCPECGVATEESADGRSESDEWGTNQEASTWDGSAQEAQGGQWDETGGAHRTGHQTQDGDTTLAALTHVLALFTWIIGPLIVYAVTDDPFARENAANATNWQIMYTVYLFISFILAFVLIGFLLIPILVILDFAFCIIAAVKARDGETWSYPLTPDLL